MPFRLRRRPSTGEWVVRLRKIGSRLLRGLDWFSPTVHEAWTFGLAAIIPLLLLCAARLWAMSELGTPATNLDRWNVQLGELEFWGVWFGVYTLAGRLPSKWWRRFVCTVLHVSTPVLLVASLAEMGFFVVTGGRADLDSVLFGIDQFEQAWPVVASELKPWDYGIVLLVVALSLLPLAIRGRAQRRTWASRLLLCLLVPAIVNETQGRARPQKTFRPLQKTLAEALFWEAMDRRDDVFVAPEAADLAPLRVGPPDRPLNVVVVFMESVGFNRTTLGNPELRTTPNLHHLAGNGLAVEAMTSVVTHTTKALIATLCGDWPNLVGDAREALPGGLPGRCLPQLLREQGYRTAFFQPARGDFEDRTDLVHQMGFSTIRTKDTLAAPIWEKNNYFGIDDRSMLAPGLEWSAERPDKPFFAAYLTLASHHDYKLPKHVQLLDFPDITGRLEKYLNAVRYVDDFVGRLVRAYEEQGLAENTLFVVLGDHGEGFGEHRLYQHDLTIYEEGLHIPAVLYGAGALGGRTGTIEGSRQQIDVLLEVLGVPVVGGTPRGVSMLAPAPEGRVLFHSCWRSHRCLARREGATVFLDHYGDSPAQVFDVAADPAQKKDLARKRSAAEKAHLQGETRGWYGRVRGRYLARQEAWLQTIQRPDPSPAIATWDGSLSLLGCVVENPEVVPAEHIWVKCTWRPERPLTAAWTLVVKVTAGGRTGTVNWTPLRGVAKMWTWTPGWSIDDTFRVALPAYTRPGEAMVSLGWERLGGSVVETDDGRKSIDVAPVMLVPRSKADTAGLEGIALANPPVWGPEWDLPPLQESGEGEVPVEPQGELDEEAPVADERVSAPAAGSQAAGAGEP
jgi:lipoteichoic acid synthase